MNFQYSKPFYIKGAGLEFGDISSVSKPAASQTSSEAPAAAAAPDVDFSQVDMPALSSTMKEGKVVSWLKAEGDAISAGDAIMVVESDKADIESELSLDTLLSKLSKSVTDFVAIPSIYVAAIQSESLNSFAPFGHQIMLIRRATLLPPSRAPPAIA